VTSSSTESNLPSCPLEIPPHFLYGLFCRPEEPDSQDEEILAELKEDPTDLAALLGKPNPNSFGQNPYPFMNAVFRRKRDPATEEFVFRHSLAIDLLEAIPDFAQRRSIVMQVSSYGANVLHIAASRGNLDFILSFQARWSSWGLGVEDVAALLTATESHGATPVEMAAFQQLVRFRDRNAEIQLLNGMAQIFYLLSSPEFL
jgi:hypothetical protein